MLKFIIISFTGIAFLLIDVFIFNKKSLKGKKIYSQLGSIFFFVGLIIFFYSVRIFSDAVFPSLVKDTPLEVNFEQALTDNDWYYEKEETVDISGVSLKTHILSKDVNSDIREAVLIMPVSTNPEDFLDSVSIENECSKREGELSSKMRIVEYNSSTSYLQGCLIELYENNFELLLASFPLRENNKYRIVSSLISLEQNIDRNIKDWEYILENIEITDN